MKYLKLSVFVFFAFCQTAFAVSQAKNLSTALALTRYGHFFKNQSFGVFPEFRENPICWYDSIPEKKIKEMGDKKTFTMNANPGEIFVFQLGVWALKTDVKDVQVDFSDLKAKNGQLISSGKMICYNLGGTDFMGTPFTKTVIVSAGRVQALWIGIDLEHVAAGGYQGSVSVIANGESQHIQVLLKVSGENIQDHGYDEGVRLSRLNWLNSTVGINEEITKGYLPVKVHENTVSILGRTLTIAENGLPASITSYFGPSNQSLISKGEPIVDHPFRFIIETEDGAHVQLVPGKLKFQEQTPSKIVWKVINTSAACDLECTGQMEFDGFVD